MKVQNMQSSRGNDVPNQFIITGYKNFGIAGEPMVTTRYKAFQSYDSLIAEIDYRDGVKNVSLDRNTWDYSRTTGKYRNQFLGETKAETQKKIDSGEYILTDLN